MCPRTRCEQWRVPPARRRRTRTSCAAHSCALTNVHGMTTLSFSARLPRARVTSLCLAKEKSPRERPPREHVLRTSLCSGFARGRRGSPTAHPCACGELAHFLCAILRTCPSSAHRVRGAPFGAHPVRVTVRSELRTLALCEAMDGRR